jgi:hypothetical protein
MAYVLRVLSRGWKGPRPVAKVEDPLMGISSLFIILTIPDFSFSYTFYYLSFSCLPFPFFLFSLPIYTLYILYRIILLLQTDCIFHGLF